MNILIIVLSSLVLVSIITSVIYIVHLLKKNSADLTEIIKFNVEQYILDIQDNIKNDIKVEIQEIKNNIKLDIKDNFDNNNNLISEKLNNIDKSTDKSLEYIKQSVDIKLRTELKTSFSDFKTDTINSVNLIEKYIKRGLFEIKQSVDTSLNDIKIIVTEKLQDTLNKRLAEAFNSVESHLESVQKGLGEMQVLAQDVGSLKHALTNVKIKGNIGEIQLQMLLEQILAPDQYEKNVKVSKSNNTFVEFAIKLPGNSNKLPNIWLPIDSKSPSVPYMELLDAQSNNNTAVVIKKRKEFENSIKNMAKDINTKYIAPPYTTDFAIMFLPYEGMYAEVTQNINLFSELQNKYKIIAVGPTTLAALLNSLQIGFKTLAIQKQSGEVWSTLVNVKEEFKKFSNLLEKAQNNIKVGLSQIDDVLGVRTRGIEKKLKNVEQLKELNSNHKQIDSYNNNNTL